ncbi:MAG: PQQ-dependent sugar dehydrogenase, partial [Actinobacteria bacterium]|nr:PQQ-dependent sugar dehydrogenase [Actinomycetota bacterium]
MADSRRLVAAGILISLLLVAGCTPEPAPTATPPPATSATPSPTATASAAHWQPTGEAIELARALDAPWSVVPLDGGALISQRDAASVVELTPAGEVRSVGEIAGVDAGGEGGLLGIAVHGDDADRWLYAYFTARDDNRVVRLPLTGAPGSYGLGEPMIVIEGIAKAQNHNGGRLAFGPDGYLYVTTGDAGDRDASQDPDSLSGKILRLSADGSPAPGNPFDSAVWSLGHRNVQGIAWTTDGTMWASEFGQDTWDELNQIVPGANYGWPVVEGAGGDADFTDPVA